jgi:hypothetical protein
METTQEPLQLKQMKFGTVEDHRHTTGFIIIIILFDEVFKYGNDVKF